jgi:hypothetical protein
MFYWKSIIPLIQYKSEIKDDEFWRGCRFVDIVSPIEKQNNYIRSSQAKTIIGTTFNRAENLKPCWKK